MDEARKPDFVVRLVGSDVKPWSVPMRALARLLDAVQRLVEQTEEEDQEGSPEPSPDQEGQLIGAGSHALRLVGIRATSAGYDMSTTLRQEALGLLTYTGQAIEKPEDSEWTTPTLSSLKTISETAKSLGVNVEIRKPKKGSRLGDVIAKITPATYEKVASTAFVRGQTSLYGRVERIGGARSARCMFRIPGESKLIYCDVPSDDLAKKLGLYLYQDVSIHGEATWLRANWRICNFDILRFDPPKTGSFKAALDDIWKAGGKAWDKIEDPNAFLADMRGS